MRKRRRGMLNMLESVCRQMKTSKQDVKKHKKDIGKDVRKHCVPQSRHSWNNRRHC